MAKRITNLLNQFLTTTGSTEGNFQSEPKLNNIFAQASQELQNYLLGFVQDYKMGFPNPTVQSQVSFDVVTLLKPFKRIITSSKLPTGNFRLSAPGLQIVKIESIWTTGDNESRVVFPAENRLAPWLKNPNRTPSTSEPIGEDQDYEYYKIYPSDVNSIQFKLYISPSQPNIVLDDNGEIDDAQTTEMQWGDRAVPFLHWQMCALVGVQVANPFLLNASLGEQQRSI
jgi:hypothetical protein